MKVSRNWLQEYFEEALPSVEELAEALTFHAFEIEEIVNSDVIDVNILPDRAADCLSHRGIGREIGAVLNLLVVGDPLREPLPTWPETENLTISIDTDKSARQMGALVRGVKVGPSPAWLREALEAIGQRSINNIVDATNYVTFNIGQPLHAFDADKITSKDGVIKISIRETEEGEKITTLSGEEFTLPKGTVVIAEAEVREGDSGESGSGKKGGSGKPLDIAGVKGGAASAITEDTKDLYVSVANFDGASIRKTSQKLKLWTDASQRFQNKISPELAAYGMRDVLELIQQVAGGEVEGVVDLYSPEAAHAAKLAPLEISVEKINALLGTVYTAGDVKNVFDRLDFTYEFVPDGMSELQTAEEAGMHGAFVVTPPFERRDLTIPETLIEEVGRIMGYENVKAEQLSALPAGRIADQTRYRGIERVKDFLTERGFTEISTQTFAILGGSTKESKGADEKVVLANPLDQTRPALRASLSENMHDALTRAANVAPRVLGPATEVKLFEIGTIFKKDSEQLALVLGYKQLVGKQSATLLLQTIQDMEMEMANIFEIKIDSQKRNPHDSDVQSKDGIVEVILSSAALSALGSGEASGLGYQPRKIVLGAYKQFSQYPFALRDIAVWTPEETEESEVANAIVEAFEEYVRGEASIPNESSRVLSTVSGQNTGDTFGMKDVQLARMDLFDRFSKQVDGKERTSYAFRLVFESFERTLSDAELNPLMYAVTVALNAKQIEGETWQVR